MKLLKALIAVLGLATFVCAAERNWPGAPPECWTEERLIHSGDFTDLWKGNIVFKKLTGEKLKPGVFSPNKGYYFVAEDGRPTGAITIFAEKKLFDSHRILRAVRFVGCEVDQREALIHAALVGQNRGDGFDLRRRSREGDSRRGCDGWLLGVPAISRKLPPGRLSVHQNEIGVKE